MKAGVLMVGYWYKNVGKYGRTFSSLSLPSCINTSLWENIEDFQYLEQFSGYFTVFWLFPCILYLVVLISMILTIVLETCIMLSFSAATWRIYCSLRLTTIGFEKFVGTSQVSSSKHAVYVMLICLFFLLVAERTKMKTLYFWLNNIWPVGR